jgi:hypothetical protein
MTFCTIGNKPGNLVEACQRIFQEVDIIFNGSHEDGGVIGI